MSGLLENEAEETKTEDYSSVKVDKHHEVEGQGYIYSSSLDPTRDLPRTANYLDEVEREKWEKERARVEGREPDLKNPPAICGTPLFSTKTVDRNLPPKAHVEADVTLPVVVNK